MTLRRNSIANTVGAIVRFGSTLVAQPLLIRILGLEAYGAWLVIFSVAGLSLLAELGFTYALTVFLSAARSTGRPDRAREAIRTTFAGVTIPAILFAALWLSLSRFWFHLIFPAFPLGGDAYLAFLILGVSVVPRIWQQWLTGWEAGESRYDLLAKGETGSVVALNFGFVIAALAGGGMTALSATYLAVTLGTVAYHARSVRRIRGESASESAVESKDIARFAILSWLTSVGSVLFGRADRLVVNAVVTLGSVGLYASATNALAKVNELGLVAIHPMMPAISAAYSNGNAEEMGSIFRRCVRFNAAVVFVLASGIGWLAPWIARVLTNERADDLAVLLRILMIVYAIYSVVSVGYLTLLAVRRAKLAAVTALSGAVFALVAIWYLGKHFGLIGATWGNAGYLVVWVMNIAAAREVGVRLRELASDYLPFVFGMALLSFSIFYFAPARESFPIASIACALSLLLTFWIDPESVRELLNRLRPGVVRVESGR